MHDTTFPAMASSSTGRTTRSALRAVLLALGAVFSAAQAAAPYPWIEVGSYSSGQTVAKAPGSAPVITVRYHAYDNDFDLTGIRPNLWHPDSDLFINNGNQMIAPGMSHYGVVSWQVTLDRTGDWYFWTDAQDGAGGYASTGDWWSGFKITVIDSGSAPPVASFVIDEAPRGGFVIRNNAGAATITARFRATDANGDLTGIRPQVHHPASGTFWNNAYNFVPVGPHTGEVTMSLPLDKSGDWYFWTDAMDANNASASSGAWAASYRITVVEAAPLDADAIHADLNGDQIPDEIPRAGGPAFSYSIWNSWSDCEEVYELSWANDYFLPIDVDMIDFSPATLRHLFSYRWDFPIYLYSSCNVYLDLDVRHNLGAGYDYEIFRDPTGDGLVRVSDWIELLDWVSAHGENVNGINLSGYELNQGPLFLVRYGKPVGSLLFDLPGGARLGLAANGAPGGTVAIPGVGTMTVGPSGTATITLNNGSVIGIDASGNITLPGGQIVPLNGGATTIPLSGGVSITIDGNGVSASVNMPGGVSLRVGNNGAGSLQFPGGTAVHVDANGVISLTLPPGTPPLIARAVDILGKVLQNGSNVTWSAREIIDAVNGIFGPVITIPTTGPLGALDLGITGAGVFQLGYRLGDSPNTVWVTAADISPLDIDAYQPGQNVTPYHIQTFGTPLPMPVSDGDERYPANLILIINDDNDEYATIPASPYPADEGNAILKQYTGAFHAEDDVVRLVVRPIRSRSAGFLELSASHAGGFVRLFAEDENGSTNAVELPMLAYDFASPDPAHPLHAAVGLAGKTLTFYLEGRVPLEDFVLSLVHRDAQGAVVDREDVHMTIKAARVFDLTAQFHGGLDQASVLSDYREQLQESTNMLRRDRDGPFLGADVAVPVTFRTSVLLAKDDDPNHLWWKNPSDENALLSILESIRARGPADRVNVYVVDSLPGLEGAALEGYFVMVIKKSASFKGTVAHEWVHASDWEGLYRNHANIPGHLMARNSVTFPAGGDVTEDVRELLLYNWP